MYNLHTPALLELIDTLWNVNTKRKEKRKIMTKELIDTLWNVNHRGRKENEIMQDELIDTLWNVNFFYSPK